ncbi:matrixin family metalloprotease [Streptomyces sp. NPDC087440]|uniref:matrixin family metalloprotease n=1 Tax=Streptomyces sp. NPDC087440 TaxID=3365790 RepID=UPI00380D0F38
MSRAPRSRRVLLPTAVSTVLAAALLGGTAPPAASYSVVGPGWQGPDITWRIVEYSRKESLRGKQHLVERVVENAMREWSKASRNVRFRKVDGGHADIEIRFVTRADRIVSPLDPSFGSPFDGPGGVAAFAFFPPRGDLYFDDEEDWDLSPPARHRALRPAPGSRGLDLYQSALHEVGHSLGFGHSDDPRSVMQPDVTDRHVLGQDDVRAVRDLYERRPGTRAAAAPAGVRAGTGACLLRQQSRPAQRPHRVRNLFFRETGPGEERPYRFFLQGP